MQVSILTNQQTMSGRVTYASDVIPLAGAPDGIFMELDPQYADAEISKASMSCDIVYVENVAVIPVYFLYEDSYDNNYVLVLKDGKRQRRYVQVMVRDSGSVVIPMGLEDGEILITD